LRVQYEINQELAKELKSLKQQQGKYASELVGKNKEENFPKRIKLLTEEVRVSKEQT
jgi:mRNA-degrading endonuclease RelE of RelBE toxin-antitoxin system